jgi:hypothetical protein
MQRFLITGACLIGLVLTGCNGAATQAILPTATPAPTLALASATPTPLPPPTVTPFPTVTPRGVAELPTDSAAPTSDLPGTPAATAALQATVAPTTDSSVAGEINKDAVLFQAGFDQGWPSIDDPGVKISIISGQYDFKIGPRDSGFISTSVINTADLYAEVQTVVTACPANSGYGLRFRQQSNGDYYALIVTCANHYSLLARINGTLSKQPLFTGALPVGIDATTGTHTVGILTRAETFSFYVDGQLVGQTSDTHFTSGDIALYAFTDSDSVIQVAFDNLGVWTVR